VKRGSAITSDVVETVANSSASAVVVNYLSGVFTAESFPGEGRLAALSASTRNRASIDAALSAPISDISIGGSLISRAVARLVYYIAVLDIPTGTVRRFHNERLFLKTCHPVPLALLVALGAPVRASKRHAGDDAVE